MAAVSSTAIRAVVIGAICLAPLAAWAQPQQGAALPSFKAIDVKGRTVDLETLAGSGIDLAILFFFTTETGDDIATRLDMLDKRFGREKLYIAAVGFKEDEAALKSFAEALSIDYFVLADNEAIDADAKYGPLTILPQTMIVSTDLSLLKIVRGGGVGQARVINYIAEQFLRRGQTEEAKEAAQLAAAEGEDAKAAKQTEATALMKEGKLDEAEAAFDEIGSAGGKAAVALERGEPEKAVEIAAAAADDPYAASVKGMALMETGKLSEAEAAFGEAIAKADALTDGQQSDAKNAYGRLKHASGAVDEAVKHYQEANTLDHFNITALSNAAAAKRDTGGAEGLTEAQALIEKAQGILGDLGRSDQVVTMLGGQIARELERANDLKRKELVQTMIKDLGARYKELQAAGLDKPVDPWTSRPMVVALLEPSTASPVFFQRAGLDLALKREVEARLDENPRIEVVDRDEIDALLQELNLGSSDLANEETRLRLGQVFAARQYGYIEFLQDDPGAAPLLAIRMVDTETTRVPTRILMEVDEDADLNAVVDEVVAKLSAGIVGSETLQGLIAGEPEGDTVNINLGALHGIQPGDRFAVFAEGEPILVGGKERPGKARHIGAVEVTEIVNEYISSAKVVELKEGETLAPDTKIRMIAAAN